MSQTLNKRENDVLRLLHSKCHIGSRNYNVQMKRFIHNFSKQGVPTFKINETYARIKLAARIIAGVEDLKDVYAISSRDSGQRAVVKFATYTGCNVTSSSRWTPGSFTNSLTRQFQEPKMIIVVDPHADYKALKEASYASIPVIALCDTHNNLKYVDVAIPCNNNTTESIAMIFWMLAREVKILRGELERDEDEWNQVCVDLFYHKNIEDLKELEEQGEEASDDEDAEENEENVDAEEEEEDEENDWAEEANN